MLRKTHISLGIATALAVVHPSTVSGCLFTVMGGALGGWLPDADLNNRRKINGPDGEDDDYEDYIKGGEFYDPEIYGEVGNDHPGWFHDNENVQNTIQIIIIIGITLFLDIYFRGGVYDYFVDNFGWRTVVGLVAFIGLTILGIHTKHRTFTHSLIGCALFSLAAWLMAEPLAAAFAFGYLSHIVIDILNKKPGNQYFWPAKLRIYLNLALSNGKCNTILGNIGVIMSIFLFFYFLVPCVIINPRMSELLIVLNSSVLTIGPISLSGLIAYLMAINFISFLAFTIEHLVYYFSSTWQYSDNDSEAVLTTLFLLAFAGGGIGMLLAVIIGTKGHISKSEESNNTSLYLVSVVTVVVWVVLSFVISNPFNIDFGTFIHSLVIRSLSVQHFALIYCIIVNLITFLLIIFQSARSQNFTVAEVLTMVLALLGGAVGGYLAMGITNRKMAVHHFTFGLPLMMIIHAIVLSLMLHYSGIV